MSETNREPLSLRIFNLLFPTKFFGNAVLGGCFLVMLAETPGQSFFLGLYTERLIQDFGIDRSTASSLFALAFACSAVSVQVMGTVLDRFGPKLMVAYATLPYIAGMMLTATANGPLPLAVGFVITRVLGPDGIAFAAKVTISRWFRRGRGRAMAVASLTVAVEILVCGGFNALSDSIGWRTATGIAACTCFVLLLSGLQFLFDSPETLNMLPDGDKIDTTTGAPEVSGKASQLPNPMEEVNFTRAEALRTFPCWVILALAFIVCVGWGGLNVHMKHVCAEQGLPPTSISVIYTVIGVCSPLGSLSIGWALDRAGTPQGKMRVCLLVPALSITSMLLAVAMADLPTGICFGVATGLYVGMFVVVASTIFASLYGRKHLGSMQAMLGGCGLLGTASGPVLLSAFKEAAGNYAIPLVGLSGCVLVNGGLLLLCRAPPPPARYGCGGSCEGEKQRSGGGAGKEKDGSPCDEGQLRLAVYDALAEN